jgi:hypothetical protein
MKDAMDFTALESPQPADSPTVIREARRFPRAAYAFVIFWGVGGFFTVLSSAGAIARSVTEVVSTERLIILVAWIAWGAISITLSLAIVSIWNRKNRSTVPSIEPVVSQFADSNGFVVERTSTPVAVPGTLFSGPILSPERPPVVAVPTLRIRSNGVPEFIMGDHQQWHEVNFVASGVVRAFVAIKLDRALPRMVLVPKGVDSELDIDPDHALPLEGDFNSYFTLYCPTGYETDALVTFTPDVMAAMVDHAQGWCAEILGEWVHFTRTGPTFEASTPAEVRKAFDLVVHVGGQVAEQASRYSDDRVLGLIADRSRRLASRTGRWRVAAALGVAYVIVGPAVPLLSTRFIE